MNAYSRTGITYQKQSPAPFLSYPIPCSFPFLSYPLLLSFPFLSYPLLLSFPILYQKQSSAPILFFLSTSFFPLLSFFLSFHKLYFNGFFFYFFKNHVKNWLSQMLYIARSIFLYDILCVFLIVFPMFIFLNFWNCYKFSFEIVKKWLEKDISL